MLIVTATEQTGLRYRIKIIWAFQSFQSKLSEQTATGALMCLILRSGSVSNNRNYKFSLDGNNYCSQACPLALMTTQETENAEISIMVS